MVERKKKGMKKKKFKVGKEEKGEERERRGWERMEVVFAYFRPCSEVMSVCADGVDRGSQLANPLSTPFCAAPTHV